MADSIKYVLEESRIPQAWYNLMADLPSPPPPVLHPGTLEAGRTRRSGAAVSDVADHAGGRDRPRDRDPGAGPRRVQAVAPEPAVPGPSAGEGAADAGAHLLQVRGREPGGQSQAQHGRRAGLLQQGGGHQEDRDRDRRRAVGLGAGVRGRALRHRDPGVHGARVRTTRSRIAAPSWKRSARAAWPSPSTETSFGRQVLARDARQPRQPGHRDFRGGRGRGERATIRSTPSAPC